MSWEVLKGFCRRRTQQLRENFQGASKTEDADFNLANNKAVAMIESAKRMNNRVAAVDRDLDDFVTQYEQLPGDCTGEFCSDGVRDMGTKFELAGRDFRAKLAPLKAVLAEVRTQYERFYQEASQMEAILDDRKTKMLEFDFFRNKVAAMRADPPADASRLPRNEQRVQDWQRAYEDSNTQAKRYFQGLMQLGEAFLAKGAEALTVEVSKFLAEVSKTSRVLFQGSSLTVEAYSAMAAVQQTATATLTQATAAVSNATTAATTAVSNAVAAGAVQAATNPSSRRYFMGDDSFRT